MYHRRTRQRPPSSPAFLPISITEYNTHKNLIDIDASHIQGNVPTDVKKFCIAVLRFFVSTNGLSYGADVGQNLVLVDLNIRGEGGSAYAETVFEIVARKEMCNVFGILHGACAAYIVDLCSVSALVALGKTQGFDGTGVSQSMNLIWHHPIRLGQKIRVVSTAVSGHSRIRTMRSELWVNNRLCISSVHSTVNVTQKPGNNIKVKAKL